jgi:acyl-CoA synthetase (AMP-forming)/AMP-acid ligase II
VTTERPADAPGAGDHFTSMPGLAPPEQPRPGPKSAGTVPVWIHELVAAYGDREAIVGDRSRLTYRELEEQSRVMARGLLARGLGKGARVGLWLANGPEWMVAFAALARCGAVAVPLSTFFSDAELAFVVRHADLCGMIVHPTFLGTDQRDRLAAALPELRDVGQPPWAIAAAPHLRWVLALEEGPGPEWAVDTRWLGAGAAGTPAFDDALLAAVESEVFPDDDVLMIYTSGSTAMPKGVLHTHRTVMTKTHYLREWMGVRDGVRSYIASPFFWIGGLTMSLFPVLDGGGTQFCTDRFEAAALLALVAKERIERVVLYPHHIASILEHPDFETADRSSLREGDPRLLPSGASAPVPGSLQIGLGMTETFGGYWWGRRESAIPDTEPRPDGRRPPPLEVLQPGVALRVAGPDGEPVAEGETGEVCIRGETVTRGLHKVPREAVIDEEGWFHTGDRVLVASDRLHFRGRLGEMIKTAGANVAPGEVAAALREIDGVKEAYVLGLPDATRGQIVTAVIVRGDLPLPDEAIIRATLRQRLSPFKVPAHFVTVDEEEIPWTPSHKVRFGVLADMVAEVVAQRASADGPIRNHVTPAEPAG